MLIKIPVITRTQDNGDGGYTMYVYGNRQELLEDHPLYQNAKTIEEKDKVARIILKEDDPYENGYIGSNVIQIESENLYNFKIKPFSLHAGQ